MPPPPKDSPDSQLSLMDHTFAQPDSETQRRPPKRKTRISVENPKPDARKNRPKDPLTGRQPSLPGIAVRGRPRLRVKRSASERAAESRRQREATGVRRVELMLTPEALAALDALVRDSGSTRTDVIARLIQNSFRRRRAARREGG